MIKVFSATDTDFSSNGDAVLRPFRAKVHKEDKLILQGFGDPIFHVRFQIFNSRNKPDKERHDKPDLADRNFVHFFFPLPL